MVVVTVTYAWHYFEPAYFRVSLGVGITKGIALRVPERCAPVHSGFCREHVHDVLYYCSMASQSRSAVLCVRFRYPTPPIKGTIVQIDGSHNITGLQKFGSQPR